MGGGDHTDSVMGTLWNPDGPAGKTLTQNNQRNTKAEVVSLLTDNSCLIKANTLCQNLSIPARQGVLKAQQNILPFFHFDFERQPALPHIPPVDDLICVTSHRSSLVGTARA